LLDNHPTRLTPHIKWISTNISNDVTEPQGDDLMVVEEVNTGDGTGKMKGVIAGETEKVVLINLESGNEHWIPKSVIKFNYDTEIKTKQNFLIDSWFLEKNKIIISNDIHRKADGFSVKCPILFFI